MAADASRPWSIDEIQEKIPALQARQEDALVELRVLGREASTAKWRYEHYRARATIQVTGSNQEARRAQALLFEAPEVVYLDPWTGERSVKHNVKITTLGLEADLAEAAYQHKRAELRAIEGDLKILQTLVVTAREASATK